MSGRKPDVNKNSFYMLFPIKTFFERFSLCIKSQFDLKGCTQEHKLISNTKERDLVFTLKKIFIKRFQPIFFKILKFKPIQNCIPNITNIRQLQTHQKISFNCTNTI